MKGPGSGNGALPPTPEQLRYVEQLRVKAGWNRGQLEALWKRACKERGVERPNRRVASDVIWMLQQ